MLAVVLVKYSKKTYREMARQRTISRQDYFTTCYEKPCREIIHCREIVERLTFQFLGANGFIFRKNLETTNCDITSKNCSSFQ